MTAIKGVGRRYSNIVLKKADIDLNKRAGECTDEEVIIVYNYSPLLSSCLFLTLRRVGSGYCKTPFYPISSLNFFTYITIQHFNKPFVLGGKNCDYYFESFAIQSSQLVLESAKRYHWRQIHTINLFEFGVKAAWRFGASEEDRLSSRSASLLGSSCPRSTHQDDRSSWSHCWCLQEEVNLTIFMLM